MKAIIRTLGAATVLTIALAFGLASCAGNQTALKTAKVTLSAYETAQQGMIIYGSLDTCPKSKPICKDAKLWARIKAADLVATTAIAEATPVLNGTEKDLGQILKAYEAIEKVKDAFTEAKTKFNEPEPAPVLAPTVTP